MQSCPIEPYSPADTITDKKPKKGRNVGRCPSTNTKAAPQSSPPMNNKEERVMKHSQGNWNHRRPLCLLGTLTIKKQIGGRNQQGVGINTKNQEKTDLSKTITTETTKNAKKQTSTP